MTKLFDKCIDVVLMHEGGFTDNPNDLGNWIGGYKTGKLVGTKYGIAARFFPWIDIPNLTTEGAKAIFYWFYWRRMDLDGINDEFAVLHIFDFGVNAGKRRAVRTAQRLVGVRADGVMGPITKRAINHYRGNFGVDYKHARREYYKYIATKRDNHIFLRGWLRRVDKTKF